MKTKIIILLTLCCVIFGASSCNNLNKCGMMLHLGETEENMLIYLNSNNIEYRLEKSSSREVYRLNNVQYKGVDFNTIRVAVVNKQIAAIEYRVHNNDNNANIENCITILQDLYGDYKTNQDWVADSYLCKYYWGEPNGNYILVEECSDTYYKVFIMDGELELKQYRGYSLYNKMMTK